MAEPKSRVTRSQPQPPGAGGDDAGVEGMARERRRTEQRQGCGLRRVPGSVPGIWIAPDFDETPEDFLPYIR